MSRDPRALVLEGAWSTILKTDELEEPAEMKTPSRTVESLLDAYPPDVQAVAAAARKALRKWLPGVAEEADSSAPVIGFGFGAGYRGVVCTLILSKSEVKLGLVRGGDLADPRGLLRGSGKVHRYIPLRAVSDLRKPGVSQLVKATHVAWKART